MRLNQLLKAKIHHATVTYCNTEYIGSIEVDGDLLDHVGILDGELVHVWAVDGPARLITYAFRGPKGACGINGGAAHLFRAGERVIIAAFALTDEAIVPKVVLCGSENEIVRDLTPFSIVG